jgi:DNA sulfur modification protein DndD
MIFKKLTLVNFGVYRGRHIFNLSPGSEQPIVLFGGKNGAGKTTLLEAIRLCLYGPLALSQPQRPSKAVYEQYLRGRIHRTGNGVVPIERACLALEFEYATAGETNHYIIQREWQNHGSRFTETLQVTENGRRLSDVDVAQWQDFLTDLIPPGLSQLFFFDGEKIQALAEESHHNQALAQAIKALLGLNIVEQLQADLSIYRRRQQKQGDLDSAARRLELLEDEQADIRRSQQELETQATQLTHQLDTLEEKITVQDGQIKRVGGGFASRREEATAAQIRLEAEIEQIENEIRELCAGLLPFSLAPEYTTALKEQLLREGVYQRWEASRDFIEQRLDDIAAEVQQAAFWEGTGAELLVGLQQAVSERVTATLRRAVELPEEIGQTELRHMVSPPEARQLLTWVEQSQTETPQRLHTLTERLAGCRRELAENEAALKRVPSDDVLAPLVEELNQLIEQKGGITTRLSQLEAEQNRLQRQAEDVNRKVIRMKEKQFRHRSLSGRVQTVVEVELTLNDFTEQLTRLRVKQLQAAFMENFNLLCRKERLIEAAEIDPHDFSITLYRDGEQATPKTDLSAGEKQIYAIAMLWALRQVSGRPLPMIIDTPLGRLDRDHRRNLINHYFPHASHQMIIFSTDTEVDADFFTELQPHIRQAYHLEHEDAERATRVSEGYFWSQNGQVKA